MVLSSILRGSLFKLPQRLQQIIREEDLNSYFFVHLYHYVSDFLFPLAFILEEVQSTSTNKGEYYGDNITYTALHLVRTAGRLRSWSAHAGRHAYAIPPVQTRTSRPHRQRQRGRRQSTDDGTAHRRQRGNDRGELALHHHPELRTRPLAHREQPRLDQPLGPLSIHTPQSGLVFPGRLFRPLRHDEPEPPGY